MSQIEFRENKILKLKNILSRKVPVKELFLQDKQIAMLQNWLKTKGYESQGPLIIYSSGIKGMEGDEPIVDSRLMIQLKNSSVRLEIPYSFEKKIRIENCLMARFYDEAEKMQISTQKLNVFAYENDLELTGETYIVFLKQEEKILTADIFMPVKSGAEKISKTSEINE